MPAACRFTDLLIVGASGQDGQLMARLARQQGIDWVGTSRSGQAGLHLLDPCDPAMVGALCDQLRPERIVLLAAQSSVGKSIADPIGTWHANTAPVVHLCEWIRVCQPRTRLVLAGSGECFGPRTVDSPAREGDPFRPASPYAGSKAAAAMHLQAMRRAYGLTLSTAIAFGHESTLRGADFVFGKILAGLRRLQAGTTEKIQLGDLSVIRDWGWAPDYVAAMLAMTDRAEPRDYILATGTSVRLEDAVRALVAAAGLSWDDAIAAPRADLSHHRAGDEQHADPSRARAELGWTGSVPFPCLAERLLDERE